MKWLHNIKPELFQEYHETKNRKKYAIRSVITKSNPKITFIIISYDDILSKVLEDDVLFRNKNSIILGDKKFKIIHVKKDTLELRQLIENSRPIKKFKIDFKTPTFFNTNKGKYPIRLPVPESIFRNIVGIWNNVSNNDLKIEEKKLINWINAHVYVSSCEIKTVKEDIGKKTPLAGFKGFASFSVQKINRSYYKKVLESENGEVSLEYVKTDYKNNSIWLDILCKFGQYFGIGRNRTAGMGVIEYIPIKN